jgi:glutaconate CoA-transferase subunit A
LGARRFGRDDGQGLLFVSPSDKTGASNRTFRVPMANVLPLSAAVEEVVRDGDKVAFEGFTHLIPFAAGHEAIRQRRRDLTLVRMTPDLLYDQMIGMGMARRAVFSWGGNPGVGSLHRFRDAFEQGWPQPLEIEEHSHAAMANAYEAGAAGLPFAVFRGYRGAELARVNPTIRSVACPYTGEVLATVPAMKLDSAVIHAQKADRAGNVLIEGIVGVQKEAVLAAKRSLATVEEVVDDLGLRSFNACVLPHWTVTAIAVVPGGAHPSYAQGYYKRDNAFYEAWDPIARDRETFEAWMEANVIGQGPEAFARYARRAA